MKTNVVEESYSMAANDILSHGDQGNVVIDIQNGFNHLSRPGSVDKQRIPKPNLHPASSVTCFRPAIPSLSYLPFSRESTITVLKKKLRSAPTGGHVSRSRKNPAAQGRLLSLRFLLDFRLSDRIDIE